MRNTKQTDLLNQTVVFKKNRNIIFLNFGTNLKILYSHFFIKPLLRI